MDYKEKYEMALEGIQEILGSGEDSIKMSRLQLRLQGIFPELKESEDEKIRKAIHIYLDWLDGRKDYAPKGEYTIRDMIAWLDRQGKHQKFRDSIQVGDKVTRNEDGVLVNLSQLNRVAKKDEKQGEQKPAECRQETKPNGGIVSEDFNDGDGYYKVNLAYLSKSQVELIENLVVSWQNSANNIAACSEDDELIVAKILCICNDFERSFECSPSSTKVIKEDVDKIDNWLKSLKERYTWKPSDEQMDALRYVTNFDYGGYKATLVSLYEQLKKLRGE